MPKVLFIDVLKDDYKVDATLTIKDVMAEKPEALAWGPDVAQQLPAPMFPPGQVNQALK